MPLKKEVPPKELPPVLPPPPLPVKLPEPPLKEVLPPNELPKLVPEVLCVHTPSAQKVLVPGTWIATVRARASSRSMRSILGEPAAVGVWGWRDEQVADLELIGGAEAPGVAASDEEGVLEGRLDPAVDQIEAVVLAEADRGDGGGAGDRAGEAVGGGPLVLGLEGRVDAEARHQQREHLVAEGQRLDRDAPAVRERHQRAVQQAVARAPGTAAATGAATARPPS